MDVKNMANTLMFLGKESRWVVFHIYVSCRVTNLLGGDPPHDISSEKNLCLCWSLSFSLIKARAETKL